MVLAQQRTRVQGQAGALRACVPGALALALILLSTSIPPVRAETFDLPDLLLLVEGGVPEEALVRLVERWGLSRELSAADWVALKRAGAPDSLLASLAVTPTAESATGRALPLPGGTGILLTNLDEEGRRIGGELPETAPANLIESVVAEEAAPREPAEPWYEAEVVPAADSGERWGEVRWGTPGGYTRYKLYHSRAPYDGLWMWVPPPLCVMPRPPIIVAGWAGGFVPPLISY